MPLLQHVSLPTDESWRSKELGAAPALPGVVDALDVPCGAAHEENGQADEDGEHEHHHGEARDGPQGEGEALHDDPSQEHPERRCRQVHSSCRGTEPSGGSCLPRTPPWAGDSSLGLTGVGRTHRPNCCPRQPKPKAAGEPQVMKVTIHPTVNPRSHAKMSFQGLPLQDLKSLGNTGSWLPADGYFLPPSVLTYEEVGVGGRGTVLLLQEFVEEGGQTRNDGGEAALSQHQEDEEGVEQQPEEDL